MCGTHRHIGGNTAERLNERPREKKIPQAPKRPALKAVGTVAKEGGSTATETVAVTAEKVEKVCKLSKAMAEVKIRQRIEVGLGESSFLDSRDADDIIAHEVGDECEACGDCTDGIEWARGIVGKIVDNRAKIAKVLPGLLTLEIARLNRKLKPVELDDVIKRTPDLMLDARFATVRAIKFMDEFYSKQPASQPVVHLGGGGREARVVPKSKIIDAEVVEAESSAPKLDESKLRKKIQGAVGQRGRRLNSDELGVIVAKMLPDRCAKGVFDEGVSLAEKIMDEISPVSARTLQPAQIPEKTLPEAKSVDVVEAVSQAEIPAPAENIAPPPPPAVVPPSIDAATGREGYFARLKMALGIGKKPSVAPATPVLAPALKASAVVTPPVASPTVPAPVLKTPVVAPSVPAEAPEKAKLRQVLTGLKQRESALPRGEKGKKTRKEFYINMATELASELSIQLTVETNKDREAIKHELLKKFGESALKEIAPEWFFK